MQVSIAELWIDLISRKATRTGTRLDLTAKEISLLSVLARRMNTFGIDLPIFTFPG